MSTINKCACGKRINKYATTCKGCHEARMNALRTEAAKVVATGCCPQCGTALKRNLALTGWWQCGAYGEADFRKPEHRALPKCSFQTFTA